MTRDVGATVRGGLATTCCSADAAHDFLTAGAAPTRCAAEPDTTRSPTTTTDGPSNADVLDGGDGLDLVNYDSRTAVSPWTSGRALARGRSGGRARCLPGVEEADGGRGDDVLRAGTPTPASLSASTATTGCLAAPRRRRARRSERRRSVIGGDGDDARSATRTGTGSTPAPGTHDRRHGSDRLRRSGADWLSSAARATTPKGGPGRRPDRRAAPARTRCARAIAGATWCAAARPATRRASTPAATAWAGSSGSSSGRCSAPAAGSAGGGTSSSSSGGSRRGSGCAGAPRARGGTATSGSRCGRSRCECGCRSGLAGRA